MTRTEIRDKVMQALSSVAPELDPASLRMDAALRDQVDLDSMDVLRFAIELHKQFGVEVPERDYPKLASLNSASDYIAAQLGVPAR